MTDDPTYILFLVAETVAFITLLILCGAAIVWVCIESIRDSRERRMPGRIVMELRSVSDGHGGRTVAAFRHGRLLDATTRDDGHGTLIEFHDSNRTVMAWRIRPDDTPDEIEA